MCQTELASCVPESSIESLADILLDGKEKALAYHLNVIMGNDKYDALLFLALILPKYWNGEGKSRSSLPPRSVFKRLYYVHQTGGMREFREKTRDFMIDIAGYLEGCLYHLYVEGAGPYPHPNLPFGPLVERLRRRGIIPEGLVLQLKAYNKAVNVPSKHFDAFPVPERLDERTFSVYDAALAFVMTRKISLQLFPIMRAKGIIGDVDWPPFDERWLKVFPLIERRQSNTRGEQCQSGT